MVDGHGADAGARGARLGSWLVAGTSGAIRAYQLLLSPLIGPRCRYLPTCSEYAREALRIHGLLRGSALAARRIGRCHPWGGHGLDPVPPRRDERDGA